MIEIKKSGGVSMKYDETRGKRGRYDNSDQRKNGAVPRKEL